MKGSSIKEINGKFKILGGFYMCGRFCLDAHIEDIVRTYGIYNKKIDKFDRGDFYPTNTAPIVLENGGRAISLAKWGFSIKKKKAVVINARAETIMEKPMFKDSFYSNRCIIPANLFYEWKDEGKRKKIKYEIGLKDSPLISLANIYKVSVDKNLDEQLIFAIITTEANETMKSIHSRMPLIIEDDMVDTWLRRNTPVEDLKRILKTEMDGKLVIKRSENENFEQLRMF